MKKLPVLISVAAGIMIFLSSCLKNSNSNTNPQQGYFLIANISPTSPTTGVSVTINGSNFTTGLRYGSYTPYYYAAAGSYAFSVYGTGTTPVLTSNLSLSTNTAYSYFLVDSFSKLKASFVTDNIIAPSSDSIYFRFFNFSPNVGTVSFKDSARNFIYSGSRTFNDQNTQQGFATFTRAKAGDYTFQLLNSGDSSRITSKKFTLDGGRVYTFFAKGVVGGNDTTGIGLGQMVNY